MAVLHLVRPPVTPATDLPPRTSPRPVRIVYWDNQRSTDPVARGSAARVGTALVAAFRNLVWCRATGAEIYNEAGSLVWRLTAERPLARSACPQIICTYVGSLSC